MSEAELKIIQKLLELKEIKSGHIFHQRYAAAAETRDKERVYEWKLIKFLGYKSVQTGEIMKKILNDYFIKNFGTEYSRNITTEFKKKLLRQIKLDELGI